VPAARIVLVAACALIDPEGRILIAQRPAGKSMASLWEFPGGKIEPGESPEGAVIREMREELGVVIEPVSLQPFAFASHAYPDFHLLMPLFLCRKWQGAVTAHEGQSIAWVLPSELSDYPMPPADLPLIPMFQSLGPGPLRSFGPLPP
jgi:8-oxo-dGTP diphosphatase